MEFSPRLVFLGDRDYVHASSLYDAILEGLSKIGAPLAVGPIKMDIRALITRQVKIFYSATAHAPPDGISPPSYFDIVTEGASIHGYVLEGDEPIAETLPFDESIIESVSEFKNKTVCITANIGMSPIQIALSLNKQLHSALSLNKPGKRMLAARLELLRPFVDDDASEMRVTLKNVIGSKLIRTTIRSANNELGSLYTSQEK